MFKIKELEDYLNNNKLRFFKFHSDVDYEKYNIKNLEPFSLNNLLRNKYDTSNITNSYSTLYNIQKIMNMYFTNNEDIELFTNRIFDMNYKDKVFSSRFLDIENMVIIKSGEKIELHEYFVGLILNKLRYEIPNFAFMFKYFTYKNINYIVYEKINGIQLTKFILINRDINKFINILLQIFFAIYTANKICGFVHFDLHYCNIIIKQLDHEEYIKYNFENKDYYLKTDIIAVIIDYGMSRIKDKRLYYSVNNVALGIDPSIDSPISDIFHLITMIKTLIINPKHIKDKINDEYQKVFMDLYKFIFDEEDNEKIEDFINLIAIKNNSNLQNYMPGFDKLNIVDFINKSIKLFKSNLINQINTKHLLEDNRLLDLPLKINKKYDIEDAYLLYTNFMDDYIKHELYDSFVEELNIINRKTYIIDSIHKNIIDSDIKLLELFNKLLGDTDPKVLELTNKTIEILNQKI